MSRYEFDKLISVTVESSNKPLPGEKRRSSYNFETDGLTKGLRFLWRCPPGVSFSVMEENPYGEDFCHAENISDGSITDFIYCKDAYIADPIANAPFDVEIIPIAYDNYSSWIQDGVDPNKKIGEIALPGTHDSAAVDRCALDIWGCQKMPISVQLESGIRLLDIRLKAQKENGLYRFKTCHGDMGLGSSLNVFGEFEDVISVCDNFLRLNPGEFIIMSVKIDDYSKNKTAEVHSCLDSFMRQYTIFIEFKNYTVADAKGHIVVMDRYSERNSKSTWGVAWGSIWPFNDTVSTYIPKIESYVHIQDHYKCKGSDEKIQSVKSAINEAMGGFPDYVINFCSGFRQPYRKLYDINARALDYIGKHVKKNSIEFETKQGYQCKLGWFFMDYPETVLKCINHGYECTASAISAIVDSNYSTHQLYEYEVSSYSGSVVKIDEL